MNQLSESTKQFIKAHAQDDVKSLALQAARYPDVDMHQAIAQIGGRQAAKSKLASWHRVDDLLYPRQLSMEQCSSEPTALYKASLIDGGSFADLTGGFGVDCSFLSRHFKEAHYVEQQTALCHIAAHNFPLLDLSHIQVHNTDAMAYLKEMAAVDWIFIDPARRDGHGGKTVAISDCEPNVEEIEPLLLEKAQRVMVKLSPMLDIALAINTLKHISEVHVVSVANECKELLLILDKERASSNITIHCINLPQCGERQSFSFTREQEQGAVCSYTNTVKQYLYEPNASILKAGGFKSIASLFDIEKLHPNSHLYTSDKLISDFPGRAFEVVSECSFNKKEMKELLKDIKKANLTIRNFPATVAELRKRIKLADGGDNYLFATTLNDEKKALILCRKTS